MDACRPYILAQGYTVFEFWDLTYGDLTELAKVKQIQQEEFLNQAYTAASIYASLRGSMLAGKKPPTLEDFKPKDPIKTLEAQMTAYAIN